MLGSSHEENCATVVSATRPCPLRPWVLQVAIKSVYKADNAIIKPPVGAETFTPTRTTYQQEFELLRAVNEQQHDRPSLHNKKTWQDDNSNVIRVLQVAHCATPVRLSLSQSPCPPLPKTRSAPVVPASHPHHPLFTITGI